MRFFRLGSVVAITLLACGTAAAATTQCENDSKTIEFDSWSYSGGAVPDPDMKMSEARWTEDGKVIGEKSTYYNGTSQSWGVQGVFDRASQIVLDDSHAQDRPEGRLIYRIQATLRQTPDSQAGVEWLVCTDVYPTVPAP
jgi:hypothetical protein